MKPDLCPLQRELEELARSGHMHLLSSMPAACAVPPRHHKEARHESERFCVHLPLASCSIRGESDYSLKRNETHLPITSLVHKNRKLNSNIVYSMETKGQILTRN